MAKKTGIRGKHGRGGGDDKDKVEKLKDKLADLQEEFSEIGWKLDYSLTGPEPVVPPPAPPKP